mgnify:FL=1
MKNKDLNFEYIEEFVDYLVEKVEDNDELFATVVCKFNEAKEIIKYLMMFEDIDFENIYLESPDEKGYTDEFCMEFWYNDGVVNFSCDPLKVNGKYENPCGDETYLFDDCSSKIIPLCDGSELYFVNIDVECDCDEDCDCKCPCDCHKEDKEIVPTEKSHYSINGKPVNKQEFDKKYDEIRGKYEKNMKRILVDYADFMDDINNIFARLW